MLGLARQNIRVNQTCVISGLMAKWYDEAFNCHLKWNKKRLAKWFESV